jgi:hypothetical protein
MANELWSWLRDPRELIPSIAGLLVFVGGAWAVVTFYFKKKLPDDYDIDQATHIDALGFLKDWVTSIIQIETALLGGIGAAVVLKNTPDVNLTILQKSILFVGTVAFGISIFSGIMLLNMLPGAAQRVPKKISDAEKNDVYSIHTKGKMRLSDWTWWHRISFLAGLAAIAAFVFIRVFFLNRGHEPGCGIASVSRR